jgi:serine O-acetyltransferase
MTRLELVSNETNPGTEVPVFQALRTEAERAARQEPMLTSALNASILAHDDLASAMAYQLGRKLGEADVGPLCIRDLAASVYADRPELVSFVEDDMQAVFERDAAARGYLQAFLFFKGFLALQTQRIAHHLWHQGRETIAFHLQSRASELFQVDIHPAVPIGRGVFLDHGTGIVIGETATVGDGVSMLQNVTLGGTGKSGGDRHPKIGRGVLLGAGAKVLGAIHIGDYAKVASGSVVLKAVPAGCTAAGVPARLVNCPAGPDPGASMDQTLVDAAYDYVI